MNLRPAIVGWDIGGVNTKAARLDAWSSTSAPRLQTVSIPYELQHNRPAIVPTLRQAARELRAEPTDCHAVTMTAELSQTFRTKREGVGAVIDALEAAFPSGSLHVYTVSGRFVSPREARSSPHDVAAANWAATARWVGRWISDCILMDVGSTTTDLIPIEKGQVAAQGRTDPERLLSGELVYTGALRTPVEAVVRQLPLGGGLAGVSAEGFALIGDAYLWLGQLREQDYTCATPDGRPATREYAGERLARAVCGDREMVDDSAIDAIAGALAAAQLETIQGSLRRILERCPQLTTAVVAGLGDPIAAQAARLVGLKVIRLADQMGDSARTAPAAAVASLLWESRNAD